MKPEWQMANGEWRTRRREKAPCGIFSTKGFSRALLLFAIGHLPFCIFGCRPSPPPAPESLTSTAERGPIRFSVEVSPTQVWIADPITVRLTAKTPDDTQVQFPDASAFGDVAVRPLEPAESRPAAEGSQLWRQAFVVESFVSGTVDIPPLVLKYATKPADGSTPAFDNELVTDTLKVEVRSALTSQDSVTAPRDITGTRVPAREPWKWWQIAALAASALAAGGIAYWAYRAIRRRLLRPPPPVEPEVWALRELETLSRRDWIASGQVREYYYRLSEIVRRYIELKFHLAAPEMTTEEFLTALSRNQSALPYDALRLRVFMEACDLVKYAAFAPRSEDATDALLTARAFIHATAAVAAERARSTADMDRAGRPPAVAGLPNARESEGHAA
jgi:hypothetical protein